MTDLSPTAQAVLDAYIAGLASKRRNAIAAALRALDSRLGHEVLNVRCVDCSQIELIAAELEGNHPGSPDGSDGPAVSDDREPASVIDQLKYQLFLRVKADLIREVINQALKDTASVHWRVTDTGEQIVRVGDLLRWAKQAANKIEAA